LNLPRRKPDPLASVAAGWLVRLVGASSVSSLLPELNAWLQEDESHRKAFATARLAWGLAGPYALATKPGAGSEELNAFLKALDEARWLIQKDLLDS
jgi:ferric-dicitrate binding protein FerR (iron transport regulator)